ncbi:MAG: RHS repeat-associated core domain-containing protein [Pseudoxanthomonas sp.]
MRTDRIRRLWRLAGWLLFAGCAAAQAQTVEYVHTDALGTPIALTDASGNLVQTSEYEPYGVLLNHVATDGPGFTGHVEDAATGLTYMQQRYYDPALQIFYSRDPVTALSNSVAQFNSYRYANGNPYRFVDPDGRYVVTDNKDHTCSAGLQCDVSGGTGTSSARSSTAQQSSVAARYGRSPQLSDPLWTRDKQVRDQMEDAWVDSNPNAPAVPKGVPGSIKHEQGGWVIRHFGSEKPELIRSAPGTRDQMSRDVLNKPSEFECACRVLGFFHTHPNTRAEGYMPNANGYDYLFQLEMGVPGMIRSHEGYEFIPIPEGQ